MNKVVCFAIVLGVVAVGYANPSIRVGKLKHATKLTIHKQGKDPISITNKANIDSIVNLIEIKIDRNRVTAGTPPYRIEFWRSAGDRKPFEEIWVDQHGSWGFVRLRTIYGNDRKIVERIETFYR